MLLSWSRISLEICVFRWLCHLLLKFLDLFLNCNGWMLIKRIILLDFWKWRLIRVILTLDLTSSSAMAREFYIYLVSEQWFIHSRVICNYGPHCYLLFNLKPILAQSKCISWLNIWRRINTRYLFNWGIELRVWIRSINNCFLMSKGIQVLNLIYKDVKYDGPEIKLRNALRRIDNILSMRWYISILLKYLNLSVVAALHLVKVGCDREWGEWVWLHSSKSNSKWTSAKMLARIILRSVSSWNLEFVRV